MGNNSVLTKSSLLSNHTMVLSEPAFSVNWRRRAQRLQKEAHVFYIVFKHPRTRWYTRLVAACTAAYVFSPVQLIPNFIPVIGSLDDFLVLFLGAKLLRRITPPAVMAECRNLADAAKTRRNAEVRWSISVFAPLVILAAWVLAGITAGALMAAYIYH